MTDWEKAVEAADDATIAKNANLISTLDPTMPTKSARSFSFAKSRAPGTHPKV